MAVGCGVGAALARIGRAVANLCPVLRQGIVVSYTPGKTFKAG